MEIYLWCLLSVPPLCYSSSSLHYPLPTSFEFVLLALSVELSVVFLTDKKNPVFSLVVRLPSVMMRYVT